MIAYTLTRWWKTQRQGWDFRYTVIEHSMLSNRGPRQRWAGSLPWGPLTSWHVRRKSDHAGWAALLTTLWRWGEGWERDPCPKAVTWSENPPGERARGNVRTAGLVRLDCPTSNVAWGKP